MTKFYCGCCARQLVDYPTLDCTVTKSGAVSLGFGNYCCKDCRKDLDENGLFPEERHYCLND
jgi:hypothetical protein